MRTCVIAGCNHRLHLGEWYVCGRCWKQYVPDGVRPPWLTALILMAAAEAKAERKHRQFDIPLSRYDGDEAFLDKYTTSGTERES